MWRDIDPRDETRERPAAADDRTRQLDDAASRTPAPHDALTRDLDLPRGTTRRPVRDRDRSIALRESEVRILATTGAFRVVVASDLRDERGRPADPRNGEPRRLREAGRVATRPFVTGRERATLVSLTDRGRDLLERH